MEAELACEVLAALGSCGDEADWIGDRTPKQAWLECPRGDWLLWVIYCLGVDAKLCALARCGCARTALKYVPAGEDRPRIAIETCEAWCRGEATEEDCQRAALASWAAMPPTASATAVAWSAMAVAATAAAEAAAEAAAGEAARKAALAECADIVRGVVSWEVVREAMVRLAVKQEN